MHSISDKKGLLLIMMSSVLLGIWSTVDTIALRNIILVFGSIIAISYLVEWIKTNQVDIIENACLKFVNWPPLLFIGLMFVWIAIHYLFFSQFPEKQFDELTSTWLRAFLAAIIGFGCAIALRRNTSYAWLLSLGLIASFLLLIYQYIPKAIAYRSLFAPDYFGNYIYWAKFSGVLAGIILFASALGLLIDSARQLAITSGGKGDKDPRFNKATLISIVTLGLILPIFSFVFIFSAKNGVGVAAILLIFWFMVGGVYLWAQFFRGEGRKQLGQKWARWTAAYIIIAITFSWLAYLHAKNNPGWESLIEDIRIAAQIDTHQNWKSPPKYGYPKRADGSSVAGNTYERVAWGVVGLRLIADQPLGNGVLRALPSQMQQAGIQFNDAAYTHSAWIDLGLSYGWPGILLLPTALLLCLIACIKKYRGPYRATVTSLAVSFLVLYLVGEYAFQHGIEILLFVCALLAGLVCQDQKPIPDR
jgi:hypothetical protein